MANCENARQIGGRHAGVAFAFDALATQRRSLTQAFEHRSPAERGVPTPLSHMLRPERLLHPLERRLAAGREVIGDSGKLVVGLAVFAAPGA